MSPETEVYNDIRTSIQAICGNSDPPADGPDQRELSARQSLYRAFEKSLIGENQEVEERHRWSALSADILGDPIRAWENLVRNSTAEHEYSEHGRRVLDSLHNLLAISLAITNRGDRALAVANRQIEREAATEPNTAASFHAGVDRIVALYARALGHRVLGNHDDAWEDIAQCWQSLNPRYAASPPPPDGAGSPGGEAPRTPSTDTDPDNGESAREWWGNESFSLVMHVVLETEMVYHALADQELEVEIKVQRAIKHCSSILEILRGHGTRDRLLKTRMEVTTIVVSLMQCFPDMKFPVKLSIDDLLKGTIEDPDTYSVFLQQPRRVFEQQRSYGDVHFMYGEKTVENIVEGYYCGLIGRITWFCVLDGDLKRFNDIRATFSTPDSSGIWASLVRECARELIKIIDQLAEDLDVERLDMVVAYCVKHIAATKSAGSDANILSELAVALESASLLGEMPNAVAAYANYLQDRNDCADATIRGIAEIMKPHIDRE